MDEQEVANTKFCGVHRLGKHSRGKSRPMIARFTCLAERETVWTPGLNMANPGPLNMANPGLNIANLGLILKILS